MLFASIAARIVLVVACQPKAEALPQEYRSSQLGFSIRYPEGWKKSHVSVCRSGSMDLDEKGMRKAALYPVSFGSGTPGKGGLTVSVYRQVEKRDAPGEAEALPPGHTAFTTESGLKAHKTFETFAFPDETSRESSWSVYYPVRHGERLVMLQGSCVLSNRDSLEPTFDAMARTLKLFEPTEDRRTEGGVKTHRTPRFTFEYPGDWKLTGIPYDDEEAAESWDSGSLLGPKSLGVKALEGTVGQSMTFGRCRKRGGAEQNFDEAVATTIDAFKKYEPKAVVHSTEFITISGISGKRIVTTNPERTEHMKKQVREAKAWAKKHGKPVPSIYAGDSTVYYVLPLDERSAMMFLDQGFSSSERDATLDRYDAIVRSFKITRRPGEVVPSVPLSQ
jgi:hypothetical protein